MTPFSWTPSQIIDATGGKLLSGDARDCFAGIVFILSDFLNDRRDKLFNSVVRIIYLFSGETEVSTGKRTFNNYSIRNKVVSFFPLPEYYLI